MVKFIRPIGLVASILMAWSSFSAVAQVPELVAVPMSGGQLALPSMGSSDNMLSWGAERLVGDQVAFMIQQDPTYEKDSLLHDYVYDIWQRLLISARSKDELGADLHQRMAWKMFVIHDSSVNAFALPGAYIGVNLGLIAVSQTKDELASVLAHESVHIFQRHIARMYAQNKDVSVLSLASLIVGIVAMGINPNVGGAIMMGGGAAAIQSSINFTRAMEYEADRIGYKVLVGAGFRPQGMSEMFQRLEYAARFSDTTSFPYLRTHPVTSERIAEAQMRFGVDLQVAPPPDDWEQSMMSARASVLGTNKPDTLRSYVSQAFDRSSVTPRNNANIKDLYIGALAAANLRQFDKAQKAAAALLVRVQEDAAAKRMAQLLAVEIALKAAQPQQAQILLDAMGEGGIAKLRRTEMLMRAQVAVALDAPAQAIQMLKPWVFEHADDVVAWSLLATAYINNHQTILALQAEAESRMIIGDFEGAIDRFKTALAQGNVHNASIHDLEVIQVRLKAAQQAQADREKASSLL